MVTCHTCIYVTCHMEVGETQQDRKSAVFGCRSCEAPLNRRTISKKGFQQNRRKISKKAFEKQPMDTQDRGAAAAAAAAAVRAAVLSHHP